MTLLNLLALATAATALPSSSPSNNPGLVTRDEIDHDAVASFPETVPSGTIGEQYLAYQPNLYVVSGCVPFPAVDGDGNTNAGLQPSGNASGDCDSSTGQVYARSTMADGTVDTYGSAIMYSWYFPKDSPSTELGHRHDWEGVIIYLSDSSSSSAENIAAVCPSAHGDWECSTDGFSLSETHPLIRYYNTWPLNHQMGLTDTVGGTQPLIAWESLPAVAQEALENTDFGSATPPFKNATFNENLGKATY